MLYPCICNVVISCWNSGAYDFVICHGGTDMCFVPGSGWKHLDLEQYRILGLTDRKSPSGSCQFLGRSLVIWHSKKNNCVSLSTAKAEYVAAASCATQVLWMRQTLKDYGLTYKKVPILCDNESAINIANNPCQHPRTKHFDIRHHFIRDHIQKGDTVLAHVGTAKQLADIFTKPCDEARFCQLRGELGILERYSFSA